MARPKKLGRPRKYKTADDSRSAERRQENERRQRAKLLTAPVTDDPTAWEVYLEGAGLGMKRGMRMTDGPRNEDGEFVTGGIGLSSIAGIIDKD